MKQCPKCGMPETDAVGDGVCSTCTMYLLERREKQLRRVLVDARHLHACWLKDAGARPIAAARRIAALERELAEWRKKATILGHNCAYLERELAEEKSVRHGWVLVKERRPGHYGRYMTFYSGDSEPDIMWHNPHANTWKRVGGEIAPHPTYWMPLPVVSELPKGVRP